MIITAMEILEATKESMFDDEIMGLAGELHERRHELDDDTHAKFLFMYSSYLASKVADRVTHILLSESDLKDMMSELAEFDNIAESVYDEMGE
jgi:hypothetical protein